MKLRRMLSYTGGEIKHFKETILSWISKCFFSLLQEREIPSHFRKFVDHLEAGDVIITFNWDLLIEKTLEELGKKYCYLRRVPDIILLKPHGSINWTKGDNDNKASLYSIRLSHLSTTLYNSLTPYIIPPLIKKEFERGAIELIWNDLYDALLITDELYLLGYSFPAIDLHSRCIFRIATMNNSINKERKGEEKLLPIVVNPDKSIIPTYRDIFGETFIFIESCFENLNFDDLTRS